MSQNTTITIAPTAMIQHVLDCDTGQELSLINLNNMSEFDIIKARMKAASQICSGQPRYRCLYCSVPVRIVLDPKRERYHFRHHEPEYDANCPFHSLSRYSQDEINAMKFQGAKESYLHRETKTWLARSLESDPRFSNVQIEKVWKDKHDSGKWRKPDVQAEYRATPESKPLRVAFEVQLATTYHMEIAARREFYIRQEALLVWVLREFPLVQPLTVKDMIWINNQNAFVVTPLTVQESIDKEQLILDCYWREPVTYHTQTEYMHKHLPFHELTMELDKSERYHFPFEQQRDAIREAKKSEAKQRLRDLIETEILRTEQWPDIETQWPELKNKYDTLRQHLDVEAPNLPDKLKDIQKFLLCTLYSLKHWKIIGFGYQKHIQIGHNLFQNYPELFKSYRRGVNFFERHQALHAEDSKSTWTHRFRQAELAVKQKEPAYSKADSLLQNDREFWELLFPGYLTKSQKG